MLEGASVSIAASGAAAPPSSTGAWERIRAAFARRPLARAALLALALLHSAAVFAPFLANDRPFVLEAIDRGGFESALRSLAPIASSVERLVLTGDAEYERARGPSAPPTRAAALAVEERAADGRLRSIERALALGAVREELAAWRELLASAVRAATAGETERAGELAVRAREGALALREELAPSDALTAGGEAMLARRSHPLFASLAGWEIGVMLWWLWAVAGPIRAVIFARASRAGRRRRGPLLGAAAALLVASCGALAWEAARSGEPPAAESAPYKRALDTGELVPARPPRFAPIAFGFAETHALEGLLPPSWTETGQRRALERRQGNVARAGEPGLDSRWRFLAGTDELGRDFLTRLIWGARTSLSIGILSALLSTLAGVVLGALAGYFRGVVDAVVLRSIEILQSIPAFLLVLFAMAFTDPRVLPPVVTIVSLIALVRWTGAARLVRGEFLRLREREYVLAATALGFSPARTIVRHILPNAMGPILVHAAFAVSAGILTESAISFLGLGVQPPYASWGALVSQSRDPAQWWIQLFPGALIFVTVTCYNLVGDAVRDALDPRVQE